MDGLLVINKPKGWTSFDVVAKIRGKLQVKKVGHTGTLDPMATGVLVLCLGKATKLAQGMIGLDKEYLAEITLGATSNTDDAEGEVVLNPAARRRGIETVEKALEPFRGTIEQMPPQFSAKKVGGKRAYKLAREGKKVELKAVEVTIHELKLLEYEWPRLKVRIKCSKGTYIRSIARDLGEALETGAYLTKLQRTAVGQYNLVQAVTIEEAGPENIIPIS